MAYVPAPHARWDGASPLRSGLAIERAEEGTLGAVVRFANGTFFTSARHVAGTSPAVSADVLVARMDGSFLPTSGLQRPTFEPGSPTLLGETDLALFRTMGSSINVTPDGSPTDENIGAAAAGDTVHLRGSRLDDWVTTTYVGDYAPAQHDPYFRGLILSKACLGIIDLGPMGPATQQVGNSGTSVWREGPNGFQLIGHFDAASLADPLGLIVRYAPAFPQLGYPMNCVV